MTSAGNDIFISYKAEERKRLIPLVEALRAEGFDVWWDQHITGGSNWREEIERHLDAAKVVIVVWSKRTIGPEGRFVRDEAGQAQEAGHYLPITVDNVRPPLGFREVQALDFSSWWGKREDPRFQTLCDTIRNRLDGSEIPLRAMPAKGLPINRRAAIAGGAGAVAIAAAGGFFLLKPAAANAKRIAVLPFANMSGASEAYFADGLAEELRGALGRAGLQVIGRNSSEAVAKDDAATIASKLNVGHILTGSVRQSPETLRVSAQLVEARDGTQSWSEDYDRAPGDAIKIQSDIAEQVAGALSVALGTIKQAVELGGTDDPVAQGLLMQAKAIASSETSLDAFKRVLALREQAIARDPNYAQAWTAKGIILTNWAGYYATSPADMQAKFESADAAFSRALRIAPDLPSALAARASLDFTRFRFRTATAAAERAAALSPEDVSTLGQALNVLQYRSSQSSLDLANKVAVLDPLDGTSQMMIGQVLLNMRRYRESNAACQRALVLAPKLTAVVRVMILNHLALREDAAAQALLPRLKGDVYEPIMPAIFAARRHDQAGIQQGIARIRAAFGDTAAYQEGEVYAQSGDVNQAFAALAKALEVRDPGLASLKFDLLLDPIAKDARFAALVQKLDLP